MINIIVATHGPLAEALLASSRMVYGELPHVYAVTLSEQTGIEGFKDNFSQVLARAGQNADGVLVLCDMQSGTPWNVACHHAFSSLTFPPVAVVAGVNFPMLLQSEEIHPLTDVHAAADELLALTLPTLIKAAPVLSVQSDDF
ncbi:PTS fructose transporter subunit IIA [Citrobacter amalonaticus]|uniref:PTS fructose transporter subunit IIA n=1 Tax=Citrobacter amalonaticus TaxID=35703 RepID=A0A2S4RX68_CITAM|nr:PTS sugar transporter subunit IIA [Citrobacter amalonaticus]POT56019.1 PTS fructose transporter subunit IIA [Citrobacter amalonaticus]POT74327.1 PTS fructose transporter subunit IIA [Citrobacter amalonaticus]POU65128.1 PTS fructose transporter subunit IIA [Citrobacter amalonaticus]POV03962.1 PTS fructose transporter subunit IIA [Citrobacter amalonaticus]